MSESESSPSTFSPPPRHCPFCTVLCLLGFPVICFLVNKQTQRSSSAFYRGSLLLTHSISRYCSPPSLVSWVQSLESSVCSLFPPPLYSNLASLWRIFFKKRTEGGEVLFQPALSLVFNTVSYFTVSFQQFPCSASVISHSPDLHPTAGPYLYPFLAASHPPD